MIQKHLFNSLDPDWTNETFTHSFNDTMTTFRVGFVLVQGADLNSPSDVCWSDLNFVLGVSNETPINLTTTAMKWQRIVAESAYTQGNLINTLSAGVNLNPVGSTTVGHMNLRDKNTKPPSFNTNTFPFTFRSSDYVYWEGSAALSGVTYAVTNPYNIHS